MTQGYRLAPQQHRLWSWYQHPSAAERPLAVVFALQGPLELDRWRAAFARVLARYEILRTDLTVTPGLSEPFQVIAATPSYHWTEAEAPAAAADQTAFARSLLADIAGLAQPEVAVYRCGAQTALCRLRLGVHQADGPTVALLLAAWAEAYAGAGDDEPVQFVEVSEWLLELAASDAAQAGKAFWRDQTAELAKHAGPTHPAVDARERLEPFGLAGLEGMAASAVQALCLGVWSLLQARLEDASVAATCVWHDGRGDEELGIVLGPLARDLPLVLALDPELSFAQLSAHLVDKLEEMKLWQACFAWDALALEERGPWLPWSFALLEPLAPRALGTALQLTPLAADLLPEPCVLRLELCRATIGWQAAVRYASDRFSTIQAQHIADRFKHLLAQALACPHMSLRRAELLPPAERLGLLALLCGSAPQPPPQGDVVTAFLDRTRHQPEAPALVFPSETRAYGRLAAEAHSLASALRQRGLGAEDRVGLLLDLAPEAYVALLGIAMAGAVFVPMDPELPAERLRFLVADAGLALVLTQAHLVARLADIGVATALIADLPPTPAGPLPLRHPSQGAYLIYTSGSTGLPKGILVAHGPLHAHVAAASQLFQIACGDRVLQMTHLGFDPAQEQIWTALTTGAALVPARPKDWAPHQLVDLLARQAVTHANWTTSYWHHLVQAWTRDPDPPALPLRLALIGGEAMDAAVAQVWRRHWPQCRLRNAYGPTEAIVTASTALIDADLPDPLPIGRALGERRTYLLDRAGHWVAPGTPGLLALAGPLLARGYHGRPRLSAAAFRPDPWSDQAGARLYLSGDRAVLADGQLRFLGRSDHQVKVRGYRVELGEVERGLTRLAQVEEAAVITRKRAQGDLELVAFVTALNGDPLEAAALRAELATSLPDYMLPASIQQLDRFPRTSGGKIDRGALVGLPLRTQAQPERRALGGPQAEVLAAIWRELLDLREVQADAHFFELGGHSLLAIQLVSRIRAALGLHFPLENVFTNPHFAAMADELTRQSMHDRGLHRPPLVAGPRPDSVPLSFAQQRLYLAIALQPANDAYHVPMALAIHGALDAAVLERAFQALLERHESLRARILLEGDLPVQVFAPVDWQLNLVDGAGLDPRDQARLTDRISRDVALRSFDLAQGPLYRALLLRTNPREAVLCLTLHHLTCDGWSLDVLSHDLARLYTDLQGGRPSSLAPLELQYADYALWQHRGSHDAELAQMLAYWREQLTDLPAPLQLPNRGGTGPRAGRLAVELSLDLTHECKRLAQGHEVTLFMVLLAAFDVLMHHHSGQTDLIVGTDAANRDAQPLEPLIGFFINQLVLRVDLAGDPSFAELLGRVRTTTLGAYQHSELPFDKLVEDLNPVRDAQLSPFFQVKLVLVNTPRRTHKLPGLSFEALPTAERDTKLDLQLNLWEQDAVLRGQLRYRRDRFEPNWIEALVDGFKTLLTLIAAQPGLRLSELSSQLGARAAETRVLQRALAQGKVRGKFASLKR